MKRYTGGMPSAPTQWLSDVEAKPAPEPLVRIQSLVNTVDLESGRDRLADPGDASPWLVANGFLDSGAEPATADLQCVREVREALRAMLIHNAGGPVPGRDTLATLRAVTAGGQVRAEVDDDGTVRISPIGDALQSRLLDLLLIVKDAQLDGSWRLLKACANPDCRWAFYDRSRNHGGTWCEMATCGNKLKNREFRARQRGGR
jgi:predicted RNA-binding Zn ribbon-like protein